jgi:hypothetical protein
MRRPFWFRCLVALWGVWFATALTEPAGLLACPMHSGLSAVAAGHGSHTGAAAPLVAQHAAPEHASHALQGSLQGSLHGEMHGAMPESDALSQEATDHAPVDHSGHESCTCLGQCCMMAPAAMPASAVAIEFAPPLQTVVAEFSHTTRHLERWEHALPFANGPPTSA